MASEDIEGDMRSLDAIHESIRSNRSLRIRIKCEFELDGIIENFPRDRKEN